MKSICYYDSPVGRLRIAEDGTGITEVTLVKAEVAAFEPCETELLKEAVRQLKEYFAGSRRVFDLPLSLKGTPFQLSVWEALQTIPYGSTCSYQQIAVQVGNPKACRAVGMANNRNPVIIVVPCHRVIGKNGAMVGYGGGIDVKEHLLRLEHEA